MTMVSPQDPSVFASGTNLWSGRSSTTRNRGNENTCAEGCKPTRRHVPIQ
uniref:Uncharacterized protein n=1 Tax=Arundo donax TaxID=35708 RepID=A0A0A8ZE71_ARUDO